MKGHEKPDDPGGALLAAAVRYCISAGSRPPIAAGGRHANPARLAGSDYNSREALRRVVDETEGLPFMPAWRRLWNLSRLCATTFASGPTLGHLRDAIAATKGSRPFLHDRYQPPRRHARAMERWQNRSDLA